MKVFAKDYWDTNYAELSTMDGIANSKQHAKYLKGFLDLELFDVSSIIDYGMGLGYLFQAMCRAFMPYRAVGIEPSEYAFKKCLKRKLKLADSMSLELKQLTMQDWFAKKDLRYFDLGICNSVFQYIEMHDLKILVPILAKQVKVLYFTVPTDCEYEKLKDDFDFTDPYAIIRTKQEYLDLLAPYFTVVGNRVLESKVHFDEKSSHFSELIYRS